MKRSGLKAGLAALIGMLLTAVVSAAATGDEGPPAPDSGAETVIIELRVWQHVDDAEDLWVSGRPKDGRWDTLGTIPLPPDAIAGGYADISHHRYGDVVIADVQLRVWQRVLKPERIYVQACGACPRVVPGAGGGPRTWTPLGMVPLPLDDGIGPFGEYRYGDLEIAVPRANLGLLADREHLLALRDVLAGGGTELDWSAGRATADWEGITVAGTPLRVTGLNLANRGLTGELWGWLGNLTELTQLRLNGNALTGTIPSKLSLLTKLSVVKLGGNALHGCAPPTLRRASQHDFDAVSLPDCTAPTFLFELVAHGNLEPASYLFHTFGAMDILGPHLIEGLHFPFFVFDVTVGRSVRVEYWDALSFCDLGRPPTSVFEAALCGHEWGYALRDANDDGSWLFLDIRTREEEERSPYSGCIYDCRRETSQAASIEQLAASVWVNPAIGDDGEWVWP